MKKGYKYWGSLNGDRLDGYIADVKTEKNHLIIKIRFDTDIMALKEMMLNTHYLIEYKDKEVE